MSECHNCMPDDNGEDCGKERDEEDVRKSFTTRWYGLICVEAEPIISNGAEPDRPSLVPFGISMPCSTGKGRLFDIVAVTLCFSWLRLVCPVGGTFRCIKDGGLVTKIDNTLTILAGCVWSWFTQRNSCDGNLVVDFQVGPVRYRGETDWEEKHPVQRQERFSVFFGKIDDALSCDNYEKFIKHLLENSEIPCDDWTENARECKRKFG